jgi:C-terminal processing protease CtpA/Prc
MHIFLKWFTPVIGIGVAIFIIIFLVNINSQEKIKELKPLSRKSKTADQKSEKVWLEHFSNTQKLGYFYPVNEVYIETSLDKKILSKTVYRLSASLIDPYQLFCLKEELNQHRLKYYLKRDKNGVILDIYSQNKAKLNSLVEVLKNYQIRANVSLYKEDK